MKRFAFIVSLIISSTGYSQTQNILLAQVSGTDTLYYATLPAVTIQAKRSAASKRKHVRLITDIKRVYPYARLGAKILDSYQDSIASAETDREARVFYKRAEQELKTQYGREIKALNHRQGLLLIKLIDRELICIVRTGESRVCHCIKTNDGSTNRTCNMNTSSVRC